MRSSVVLSGLFALGAIASPTVSKRDTCMTYDQAYTVASTWGTLIANYTKELADASLAENLTDYSESVNSLINGCPQGSAAISLPLLAPTFTNRSAFELGQGQQAPINFNLLQVWPGCTTVNFRWETTNTAPIPDVRPVVGLITLETIPNPVEGTDYPFLIDAVYSEFDAAAWLQNIIDAGFCNVTCASTTATSTAVDPSTATATSSASTVTVTPIPSSTITASPTITSAPVYETSTSTDADGNVYVIVTSVDDVYVTETDVVTVTAY